MTENRAGFRLALVLVLVSWGVPGSAVGGSWFDRLKSIVAPSETGSPAATALTQEQMIAGLREALGVGTERAIHLLGRDGGFLNDASVHIPVPRSLRSVEKGLRAVGQDRVADQFVATLNHAAEEAVPATASILADSIRSMTLRDAQAILQGPDDAATQYFRRTSETGLAEAILPIVQRATADAGVTSAYKRFTGGLGFLNGFVDRDQLDLDRYVTGKTLDGLFLKLADEERRIRSDPVARTTDLLQTVFGGPGDG